MSSGPVSASRLYVEGSDDQHAIRHLLLAHGLTEERMPKLRQTGGGAPMLSAMTDAIRAGTGATLGFVLDANSSVKPRWQAVCSRLRAAEVDAPNEAVAAGFVGESTGYRTRVGVWLMPDNRRPGALEDFLRDLISEDDALMAHAEESTRAAKELGAQFRDVDAPKAVLRAWLAWQRQPGLPYGTAIKAGFIGSEIEVAARFVGWFRRVFGHPVPPHLP